MTRDLRALRELRSTNTRLPRELPREAVGAMLLAYQEYVNAMFDQLNEDLPDDLRTDASIGEALQRLLGSLDRFFSDRVSFWLDFSVKSLRGHVDNRLRRISPVKLSPGTEVQLIEFREQAAQLIKTVGPSTVAKIKDVLQGPKGLAVPKVLAAELQRISGATKAQAKFWAVDQTLTLNANITKARHQEAGIRKYRWVTADDERVRGNPSGKWPIGNHWEHNNKIFYYNDPPIVDPRTGARGNPGEWYYCRCVADPILED